MVATRRAHLLRLLCPLLLAVVGSACDDGASGDPFEVRIVPDRLVGNAPLRVTFDARHTGSFDGDFTFEWDFGDGETSEDEDPTHTFAAAGDYAVLVRVTEGGSTVSGDVVISVSAAADLVVTDVAVTPRRTRAGAEVDVAYAYRNAGAPVVGEFGLQVFLNTERSLEGPAMRPLGEPRTEADELAGDAPQSFEDRLPLPDDLPSGDYFLGVVADRSGDVGDANREDNVAFAPFAIEVRNPTDTGPDLTPCSFDVPAFTAASPGITPLARVGEQLAVQVCFANAGNRPVPQAGYAIFLSADEVYDPDDLEVGRRSGVALGPDDRDTFDDAVDLPLDIDPGTYHLVVVADVEDEIEEQREDNNERAYPRPFRLAGLEPVEGVDLLVSSVDVAGDRLFWTQQVSGTLVLRNLGDTDVARNFVVRILAQPTNGDEAALLSSINRSGIEAGAEETLDIRATLSRRVERGDYRITACADPTDSTRDVNRGNNCRTLQRVLDLGGDPDFDPSVTAVGFAPPSLAAGETLAVTATLANAGDDATGPMDAAVLLSPSGTFDDAVVLERFPVESIPADGSVDIERSIEVPLDLDQQFDTWRVGVAVDPDNTLRGERDEDNNVRFAAGALTVTGAMGGCAEDAREENDRFQDAADLPPGTHADLGACDEEDWFEVGVPAGRVLDVRATWDDAEGSIAVDLADADGAVLRRAEGRSGAAAVFVAPTGEVRSFLLRVTSGGARLQYTLEVTLSEVGAGPGLRARAVTASPAVTEAGATIEVSFDLVNVGGADAPAGRVPVSVNDTPELAGATPLGDVDTPRVDAGATAEVRGARVVLPDGLADGRYYLLVDPGDGVGVGALRIDADQACERDEFEPNVSPHEEGVAEGAAAPVEPGMYEDLRSCRGDDDWYAVELAAGERITVTIEFDHVEGDLELQLYGTNGIQVLRESRGLRSPESVSERVGEAGTYFVRVHLKSDDVNIDNTYDMRIEVQADGGCADDDFEPNGDMLSARVLPGERNDLVLCPEDEDWFRFNIAAGSVVRFTVNAGGEGVEMTLFDPNNDQIGQNRRNIAHQAALTGFYRLRVRTEAAEAVEYQLEVIGVAGVDLVLDTLRLSRDRGAPGEALRADVSVCQLRNLNVADVVVRLLFSADERASAEDAQLGDFVIARVPGAGCVGVQQRVRIPRGVDAGEGFVVAVVDPLAGEADLNRRNNERAAAFAVVAACVDDDLRTNEGPATATPLEPGASPHEGGVVCAHTQDWYALPVEAGEVVVRLAFDNDVGDLDLALYRPGDGAPVLLGASETEDDEERVAAEVEAGELLIQVLGFDDAAAPYTLSWTLP